MKIYWSYKDIPELAGLPASVGHKNYKQARSLANSHIEMWLGGVLYVVLVAGLSVAFDRVFPGKGGFAHSLVTTACALMPGIFLWHQISIYVMRKYYKHILARRSAASGASSASSSGAGGSSGAASSPSAEITPPSARSG